MALYRGSVPHHPIKVELNALSDLPLALARVYKVVLTRNSCSTQDRAARIVKFEMLTRN
jgi:hypothetical protein